ncbi:hypothetical protein BCF55_0961 [Hydrogenivirga caldilitoris]|uniref:Uncharacterized protein n=1 Tax=Hydrogenivirga caldilitoris TaxID=246264 RepID=A0A497XR70_9AQUI|nr:2-oxoisovalerate dehydrogenase [Hydrogenivirga caldilitoris]RLJ70680.1 hypothetical protein BCF55_0961 [Hydrogenivirga caldilitoris]
MERNELVFIVEEEPEGGYTAKAVGHAIFTQGETLEELKENIKDAVRCHFEREEELPSQIKLHIIREEVIPYA